MVDIAIFELLHKLSEEVLGLAKLVVDTRARVRELEAKIELYENHTPNEKKED